MKNENSLLHLIEILSLLEKQIDNGSFSPVEKSILLDRISKMYEKVLTGSESVNNSVQETAEIKTQVTEEPVEIKPEPIVEIKPEPVVQKQEPVIEKIPDPVIEIKPEPEPIEAVYENVPAIEDITIAVTNDGDINSVISEILHNITSQHDYIARLKKSPVSSLKTALSINDRIMFTRDLFKGNSDEFHNSMEEVNKLGSLDEALVIISKKIEVKEQNPAIEKLVEVLYRRFLTTDEKLK